MTTERLIYFGLFIIYGILVMLFTEPTITVSVQDQRICGADPATHVWYQYSKRLVICSRPSGLVVVEVPR